MKASELARLCGKPCLAEENEDEVVETIQESEIQEAPQKRSFLKEVALPYAACVGLALGFDIWNANRK